MYFRCAQLPTTADAAPWAHWSMLRRRTTTRGCCPGPVVAQATGQVSRSTALGLHPSSTPDSPEDVCRFQKWYFVALQKRGAPEGASHSLCSV